MSTHSRRSKPRSPASPLSSSDPALAQSPSPSQSSPPSRPRPLSAKAPVDVSSNILLFLIGFRLLNALTIRTLFQPDEFFQSLEPAWKLAFGEDQGAWITWEWEHQLRSSLHPLNFATVYSLADLVAQTIGLSPASRADLLVAAPGLKQATIAAVGDFYTWKLARYIYGDQSYESWATLALTVVSPWQWFCSTRTLSNCLESTITITALYLWPWGWASGSRVGSARSRGVQVSISNLRECLLLAAFACVLRPTNVIIWIILASVALHKSTWTERSVLAREALLCGSSVLGLSAVVDRYFYGFWTFPPLRFLYFNVAQSLAVFYGKNDWSYYASQGYPLLLTTALPFALVGLYRTLKYPSALSKEKASILVQLALVSLVMPAVLSVITHKEVRFIYPLLPALHILSASPLVDFFLPALASTRHQYIPRRLTLIFLLLVNVVIAIYTTIFHASGVISVLSYLRQQHQVHGNTPQPQNQGTASTYGGITVGFLMPCHSTPWRSHLVEPTIHAWALTCEPPVGLNEEQKAVYLDEADQFYDNPKQFLQDNMVGGLRHIPRRPSYSTPPNSQRLPTQKLPPHEWPDYLIFFAQLEPTLKASLRSSSYGECWRTYNTAWHDDWRRRGDVVVWCLDPSEQQAWRFEKQQRALAERERQFDRIIQGFASDSAPSSSKSWAPWTWTQWTSPFSSSQLSSSWSWPWERRKKPTVFGFEVPAFPEWGSGWFGGKKKKRGFLKDFWF
ncbi:putative glycosylphosphatidylinositol-alpha 1,2 mannosyltransferase [Aspergillus undulatus]|uniref:putative glycosylphosphatidylinositol-alpha 1,2 mannosyltransferase n=1 Tax=Aspergillus undulatus TaxID=1810928 RepID=UPI003CCCD004